jgi:hypothetical protein
VTTDMNSWRPTLADAIPDRPIHTAYKITLNGGSALSSVGTTGSLQARGWLPSFPRSGVGMPTGTLQRAYTRRYKASQVGSIYFCSPNQSKQHIRHSPSGVRRGRRQFFLIVFCRSHASASPLHSDAGASGDCIPTLERGNDKGVGAWERWNAGVGTMERRSRNDGTPEWDR